MHQKSEVIVKKCWIAPHYALLNSQSHFVFGVWSLMSVVDVFCSRFYNLERPKSFVSFETAWLNVQKKTQESQWTIHLKVCFVCFWFGCGVVNVMIWVISSFRDLLHVDCFFWFLFVDFYSWNLSDSIMYHRFWSNRWLEDRWEDHQIGPQIGVPSFKKISLSAVCGYFDQFVSL